jgi:hypothetical protein
LLFRGKNKDLSACGVGIEDEQRKELHNPVYKEIESRYFSIKNFFFNFPQKIHGMIGTQRVY